MEQGRSAELNITNPEITPEQLQRDYFKSLATLTPEEKKAFREQSASSDGVVRVMVHPYYEQYHNKIKVPETGVQRDPELPAAGTRKIVSANFTGVAEKKPPIIIFEEMWARSITEQTLAKDLADKVDFEKKPYPIYFVSTKRDGIELPSSFSQKSAYELFRLQLKDLGVKKVVLGGSFAMTPELRTDNNGKPYGCVNALKGRLGPDFEIEISNFIYPATRAERDELDKAVFV